jgi:RNA polymerase sigma factor (sigma-70 family)
MKTAYPTVRMTEEQKQKVEDNIRLVHSYYNKYLRHKNNSATFDEEGMKSELFLALCKAVQGFDPDKNVKFSTYAYRGFFFAYTVYVNDCIKNNRRFFAAFAEEEKKSLHKDFASYHDCVIGLAEVNYVPSKKIDWKEIEYICKGKQAGLTIIEKKILRKYCKEDLSFKEIGKELRKSRGKGCFSRERIRQIHNKALEKIKKYLEKTDYKIRDFYDYDYT